MKKQNEEQNGEAVFIETACGMLLQIVLLLHTAGLHNTRPRGAGISHCGGGGLMTRPGAYVISFPGNHPHSLQHTKAVVSTPASWLFLEKAFLGMSAWLGLMPNMFMSQVSWQDCERSLCWYLCAPEGCEWPSYRCLPGSEPQHRGGQQLPVGFPWTCCLMQRKSQVLVAGD